MRKFTVNFICRVCKENSTITVHEHPENNFQIVHSFIGLEKLPLEERQKHNCESHNCDSLESLSDDQIQSVVNDWFDECSDCQQDRFNGEAIDDAYRLAMLRGSEF